MRLKAMRKAAGLSQAEAAARLGVVQSAVSCWETGKYCPRSARLEEIAQVYHCAVEDLLGRAGEQSGTA